MCNKYKKQRIVNRRKKGRTPIIENLDSLIVKGNSEIYNVFEPLDSIDIYIPNDSSASRVNTANNVTKLQQRVNVRKSLIDTFYYNSIQTLSHLDIIRKMVRYHGYDEEKLVENTIANMINSVDIITDAYRAKNGFHTKAIMSFGTFKFTPFSVDRYNINNSYSKILNDITAIYNDEIIITKDTSVFGKIKKVLCLDDTDELIKLETKRLINTARREIEFMLSKKLRLLMSNHQGIKANFSNENLIEVDFRKIEENDKIILKVIGYGVKETKYPGYIKEAAYNLSEGVLI